MDKLKARILCIAFFVVIQICWAKSYAYEDECPSGIDVQGKSGLNTPWWPLSKPAVTVGINNTEERADFHTTISGVLEELGATLVNLTGTSIDSNFADGIDAYWGLHLNDLKNMQAFSKRHIVNTVWSARSLFGDKDGLATLEKHAYKELGFDAHGFSPESFILPQDLVAFKARVKKNPGEIYVRKRLNTHSGSGIKLLDAKSLLDLVLADSSCGKEHGEARDCITVTNPIVAQRYVDDPLLVYGHKFDVRWWLVITNLEPLRVYMLRDAYAKIATSMPYDINDISSKCAHVTNNAVQKQCMKKFRVEESVVTRLDASLRSDDFAKAIYPIKFETLYEGAKEVMRKVLRVSSWRLEAQRQIDRIRSKMFQVLAIDVIYERQGAKARLIEINTNGYLQTGILKIENGREKLKEMFRLVGFVGYNEDEVAAFKRSGLAGFGLEDALQKANRGRWELLDVKL